MARRDLEDLPGPHPDPPSDLSQRALPISEYASDLYRIYRRDKQARFFGRTRMNRWDAPDAEFGVMYTGTTPFVAFAEALLPAPGTLAAIATSASMDAVVPVSAGMIAARGLALITIVAPLRCVDLRGPGLAHLGADARLTSGSHVASQRWSLAFWLHSSAPDGILYQSRRDPSETALAIYNRASAKIRVQIRGGLRDPQHEGLLAQFYMHYHVAELP